MATLFTKIIRGELPSYKVFENEKVYAFLALDQINPGHTLVVPKVEADHMMDVPRADLLEVFAAAQTLSAAIRLAMTPKRVGLMVQGFEVPHFHVHLIPVNNPGELDFSRGKRLPAGEMEKIQHKILQQLREVQLQA